MVAQHSDLLAEVNTIFNTMEDGVNSIPLVLKDNILILPTQPLRHWAEQVSSVCILLRALCLVKLHICRYVCAMSDMVKKNHIYSHWRRINVTGIGGSHG